MHTAVRKYRVTDVDEVVKRVNEGFAPIVKGIDGFGGYWIVDGGGGQMATITVGSESGVEESTKLAADWVQENAADLIEERLDDTTGELKVSVTPDG